MVRRAEEKARELVERARREAEGIKKAAVEEAGRARREVEALEAKKDFLECAIRGLLEHARRVREEVEEQRPTAGGGSLLELLERLPRIQPIREGVSPSS
jgi:vacuolar-type H+-ATPase subunit H